MNRFILSIVVLFSLSACQQQSDDQMPVATAFEYTLYQSDLFKVLPDNVHGQDSVVIAQSYINQWLHKSVELHYATMNLKEIETDFSSQIEDYRNSLMIYEYQKRLVQQRLDTVVSDNEISDYYENHKAEFTLKRNIVQVVFLKIPTDEKKTIKQVKQLIRTYTDDDVEKLKDIADRFAVNYLIDDDIWVFFDDFVKEVPIKTYNQVSFLKNNRVVTEQDSLYTFLVRIRDFKIADSFSPIEFEWDRIRSIIINIRKLELISRMKKEVFAKAQEEGKIIIN